MRLGMRVTSLSAGVIGAVVAGVNPPQILPRSFLEVSPFSYNFSRIRWV